MSHTSTWNRSIAAPVGTQSAVLDLTEKDGGVAVVVTYARETLPLLNPVLPDNRLTWQLSISKPRLHLTFDVTINGDTLTGTSKAGILPPISGTFTRIASAMKGEQAS